MNTQDPRQEALETHMREVATRLVYPPTPEITSNFRSRLATMNRPPRSARPVRLLAGALAILVLLLVIVFSVPQVRAAVLEFFQIGAVNIFVDDTPGDTTSLPNTSLLELAGETTLNEASAAVGFPIPVPAYPADLGPPDQVFLQELVDEEGVAPTVILVWLDPEKPGETQLALYLIDMPFYGIKQAFIESLRQSEVDNQLAFWVPGPHRLLLSSGDYQEWVFVAGNVLVWTDDELTYRLESGLSMEEAVRIGESLTTP